MDEKTHQFPDDWERIADLFRGMFEGLGTLSISDDLLAFCRFLLRWQRVSPSPVQVFWWPTCPCMPLKVSLPRWRSRRT